MKKLVSLLVVVAFLFVAGDAIAKKHKKHAKKAKTATTAPAEAPAPAPAK